MFLTRKSLALCRSERQARARQDHLIACEFQERLMSALPLKADIFRLGIDVF